MTEPDQQELNHHSDTLMSIEERVRRVKIESVVDLEKYKEELVREVMSLKSTVAEFIQNNSDPIFTYYNHDWPADQENNPLSYPAPLEQVSLVKIFIRSNTDPSNPEKDFTLEPAVKIRSLN